MALAKTKNEMHLLGLQETRWIEQRICAGQGALAAAVHGSTSLPGQAVKIPVAVGLCSATPPGLTQVGPEQSPWVQLLPSPLPQGSQHHLPWAGSSPHLPPGAAEDHVSPS